MHLHGSWERSLAAEGMHAMDAVPQDESKPSLPPLSSLGGTFHLNGMPSFHPHTYFTCLLTILLVLSPPSPSPSPPSPPDLPPHGPRAEAVGGGQQEPRVPAIHRDAQRAARDPGVHAAGAVPAHV